MKTSLAAWHTTHGVVLIDDRGVELPERFSNLSAEYQAVREKAGLIDLGFRTQLRMTGEDRVSFLQGMISNDVKALRPGDGCAATLLTEQGRIVADLRIYALENCFLLDTDVRIKEKVIETLSRFLIADDVEIEDLSETQTTLAIQGPLATQVLSATGAVPLPSKEYQHAQVTLADVSVRVVRVSDTGEEGYEFFVPCSQADSVWKALLQAGAPLGLQPVGLTALHTLRVETGIPWYGVDMDEARIVLEVGLDHAISFKKGCYLGQEVVERASARGHVNRKLCGLIVHGDENPMSGDKLLLDAREVGWITSVAHSPRFLQPIALGYVRHEYLTPGTKLHIDRQGTPMIAEVTTLPFPR